MRYLGKIVDPKDLVTKEYVDGIADSKVNKVEGKSLSTNDFTNEDKNKLASIEENATATSVTIVRWS